MAHLPKLLRIMRKFFAIVFLLIAGCTAMAQGLEIDTQYRTIRWSTVVESTITQDEIIQQILAYDILDNVVTHGNMIAGDIPPVMLDYRTAGYSSMKVATYILNYHFSGRVIIHFKEGRYKIEVVNMNFGGMPLFEGVGEFAFDTTARLVMQHLESITTFYPIDKEW